MRNTRPRAKASTRDRLKSFKEGPPQWSSLPEPGASPLIKALARPEAYPGRPERVTRLATHISWVFLAGDRAYKVKRPVRYPFLDYSTLERRKFYCREEVRLNRRLAPDIYLGVVPVTADLSIGGSGPAIDYAVEMVRLPAERMLDAMVGNGEVDAEHVERIAAHLARFHERAETGERVARHASPEAVRTRVDSNLEDSLIVVRTTEDAYVAASIKCTHRGVEVEYRSEDKCFQCASLGGSRFKTSGEKIRGFAKGPLKTYPISCDDNTLIVRL